MKERKHIFNASFYTTPAYHAQWQEWLHAEFIPAATGIVPGVTTEVFEVHSAINEGMLIFSVQFGCTTLEELAKLEKGTEPVLENFKQKFGEQVTNFNSVLKQIV